MCQILGWVKSMNSSLWKQCFLLIFGKEIREIQRITQEKICRIEIFHVMIIKHLWNSFLWLGKFLLLWFTSTTVKAKTCLSSHRTRDNTGLWFKSEKAQMHRILFFLRRHWRYLALGGQQDEEFCCPLPWFTYKSQDVFDELPIAEWL